VLTEHDKIQNKHVLKATFLQDPKSKLNHWPNWNYKLPFVQKTIHLCAHSH